MNAELSERECDEFRCGRKALPGKAYCGWHSEQEPRPDEATSTQEVERAYRVLRNWSLSTIQCEDGSGYPLVDAVSTPETTIATGETELSEIACAVVEALTRRPADEVTEAMIEAGIKAWHDAPDETGFKSDLHSIYLAMRRAALATPNAQPRNEEGHSVSCTVANCFICERSNSHA